MVNEEGRVDAAAEREFLEFMAVRQGRLFRVALLLAGDHQRAEDLLQTTLVKLAQNWPRVRRAQHPDAYVRRVMYHEQISWWRRRAAQPVETDEPPPDRAAPGDLADRAALRLSVAAALRELPVRQRTALVLRFFEDLPERDVAAIMHCGVGTVRTHIARALSRLRERCPDLAMPATTEAAL